MAKVEIIIQGGAVVDVVKPDFVEVVIKDFDTDGVDESVLQNDEDGDEYQEFTFPAEKTKTPIDDVEMKIRSYYKHCGEEWSSDWDSACDDECPKCLKAISPYDYEDIVTDIKI